MFSSYGFFINVQDPGHRREPTIGQIGLAGAGAGIVASFVPSLIFARFANLNTPLLVSLITCPVELIKIRQQSMVSARPSAREIALHIFRTRGIRGLYRGITATALRDCGYGTYFATVSHR